MKRNLAFNAVFLGWTVCLMPSLLFASDIPVPEGFEDFFKQRQNGIFDVVFNESSIGSFSAEYSPTTVWLSSPQTIVENITAVDMPALTVSREQLMDMLSKPLQRTSKNKNDKEQIVVWINESDATLTLLFPASFYQSVDDANDRSFIAYKNNAGFVHSHNINYLSDSYGDSFSFSSIDALNMTGNSSIRGAWSYSEDINFNLEELALYLENGTSRFKAGRQRMSDNFVYSTPSLTNSFFNPVSFDGVSLGYMNDNYLRPSEGAASSVNVFMSQAGTVEVYRNGRLIDIQQFPAGMQTLNTQGWAPGGYDVQLVTKLPDGQREEKTVPFFKRSGAFRSGDLEYTLQLGRYDQHRSDISRALGGRDDDVDKRYRLRQNNLAGATLGYTTSSAFSFGGGVILDDDLLYYNASADIPMNYWFAERIYSDMLLGNDNSYSYQVGLTKNLYSTGFNASYRISRYKGPEDEYQRFGIVPAYDFDYLQFGVSTQLPFSVGASLNYSLNTMYQSWKQQDKSKYKSWDFTLNRDFTLNDFMNLHVDMGYHHGINTWQNYRDDSSENASKRENKAYVQFSLGMRERSYNHYQSLYLRSRLTDKNDENTYSGEYALDLRNPDFDRGGKYQVNASLNQGPRSEKNGRGGVTVDNRYGYSSLGVSKSFNNSHYSQYYLSQRGGLAIGDGNIAFGKMDSASALIVDATSLPKDQYFEVKNKNAASVVVKGGQKTTLSIQPYTKVSPSVEQVYTGDKSPEFYNLSTKSTSTWAMPGQVYSVKVAATKNQTVTGRIYYQGKPLVNARVVGGNTISDNEGLFVGDFTLETNGKITELTVKKDDQTYLCPINDSNVRMTQGVMQIREAECEIQ